MVVLCLTAKRPFETVFQSISGRFPKRGRKENKNGIDEKKCPNNPHPHLLQAQLALVLPLSKLVRRPGTRSLPSTTAPPDHRVWSGGAMALGKLPVPGRPTIWIIVGQGPIALAVGAGGGCLDIFTLYLFSPLFPSLWETARYRLKYCLKVPLNPKSTNHPTTPH